MQDTSSPATWVDFTRNSDQLRLLIEVSEAVATHRDLTALFRDLAKRLPAIVRFEFIALFLHDPEKNVMRVDTLGTSDADSIPPGLELPVDTDAYNSVGGFVFGELGRLPKRGDTITHNGYSIRVESVRENRIEAVRIRERRAAA